jgi:hypothetical protein
MNPNDTTAIERFVRGTLGCQCPDEVFRRVEVGPLPLPAGAGSGRRLLIGGRLLIHIVEAPERLDEPDWLERLAAAGRDERDGRGYNRFRLVVATATAAGDTSALEGRFIRALGGDERAHLHVVEADQLPIV